MSIKLKVFIALSYVTAVKLRFPPLESRSYWHSIAMTWNMLTLCHRLYCLLQGIKGVHLLIIWQPAWERLRGSRQSITEVSWVSAQGTLQGWLILGLKLGFCSNMEYNIYLKGILLTHTAFSLSTYTHRSMCASVSVFLFPFALHSNQKIIWLKASAVRKDQAT